jgi:hypothetical protein
MNNGYMHIQNTRLGKYWTYLNLFLFWPEQVIFELVRPKVLLPRKQHGIFESPGRTPGSR